MFSNPNKTAILRTISAVMNRVDTLLQICAGRQTIDETKRGALDLLKEINLLFNKKLELKNANSLHTTDNLEHDVKIFMAKAIDKSFRSGKFDNKSIWSQIQTIIDYQEKNTGHGAFPKLEAFFEYVLDLLGAYQNLVENPPLPSFAEFLDP